MKEFIMSGFSFFQKNLTNNSVPISVDPNRDTGLKSTFIILAAGSLTFIAFCMLCHLLHKNTEKDKKIINEINSMRHDIDSLSNDLEEQNTTTALMSEEISKINESMDLIYTQLNTAREQQNTFGKRFN